MSLRKKQDSELSLDKEQVLGSGWKKKARH